MARERKTPGKTARDAGVLPPDHTNGTRASTDITDRKSASREQARLAAIVQSSDDAIISSDLDGTINSWNAAAERMYGYSTEEAIGKPVTIIIPEDRRAEHLELYGKVRRGVPLARVETERRAKDGHRVPISLTVSPVRDPDGTVVGVSKIAHDISDRKAAEARQQLLMAELDHRVKNSLAVVMSLASQTLAESATLDDFRASFEGRLMALAKAHSLLSQRGWSKGTLWAVIKKTVEVLETGKRCTVNGDDVDIPPRVTLSLAMVFHELATNASKYGAFASPSGRVHISWTTEVEGANQVLQCDWNETGGPPAPTPHREGFGTKLIRVCAERDLNGEVHFNYGAKGLHCRLRVRWPRNEGDEGTEQ